MIGKDGYFDWAIRDPGHPQKLYPDRNREEGIAWHSAEGWMPALRALVKDWNRKASWTGSIGLHGDLYQHYPVWASTWASGGPEANTRYWAFELEGLAGDLPTASQMNTLLRIAGEYEASTGRKATRALPERTMWMHRELTVKYGTASTSCPSNRYSGFFAKLEEADVATVEEIEELFRRTGGRGEVARNADLLAYSNGLNEALLTMGKDLQELRAAYVLLAERQPEGKVPQHSHVITLD